MSPRPALVVAVTTLLAAGLRFYGIGAQSFWVDEATSYAVAHLRWPDVLDVLLHQRANMALYLVLLHEWLKLGSSEGFIRALSALFSIATIPLLFLLARRLFDTRVALVAALLLAVNGFDIWHAQNARAYSLLTGLTVLSFFTLDRAHERRTPAAWMLYAAATTLAVYAHFIAILLLPAQAVTAAIWSGRARLERGHLTSVLASAALAAPLLWIVATRDAGDSAWIAPTTAMHVARLFVSFAGQGHWPLLLVHGVFVAMAVARGLSSAAPGERRLVISLVAWLLVPMVLTLLISVVKPMFVDRYLLIAFPPFVLLSALGIARLPTAFMRTISLVAVLAFASRGVAAAYEDGRIDWRSASLYMLSQARSGDAAVFDVGTGRRLVDYYRDSRGFGASPSIVFPSDAEFWLPNLALDPAIVEPRLRDAPRVWLFQWYGTRSLEAPLTARYGQPTVKSFKDVTVYLFEAH